VAPSKVVASGVPSRALATKKSSMTKRGLAPVADENSRVLILGTLPGDESLRQQRYYSDPSNLFWSLMSGVFGAPVGDSYSERLEFLASRGVALWDVLQSAERAGSSDSAITNPQPNAFGDFFARFSHLRRVAFNGTKAEALWRTHIREAADVPQESLTTKVLPSSSRTPGLHVLPYEEKLVRWKEFLRALRVTLDTGGVGPERKRIEAACEAHDVDLANTTVTERELRGTKIAPLSKPIREVLVIGETPLGAGVLAGDDSQSILDRILEIIGDGSFPRSGRRETLTPGQHNQLRDAMIFEAHVREKRDIFVTTDVTAFVNDGRREKLETLCSTRIMTVDDFCHYMSSASASASASR